VPDGADSILSSLEKHLKVATTQGQQAFLDEIVEGEEEEEE